MTLTFSNKKTTTKDGKTIAFAEITLHIDGEKYPVRLAVTGAKDEYIKLDKGKLNNALKAKGFVIGEIEPNREVGNYTYSLKGE